MRLQAGLGLLLVQAVTASKTTCDDSLWSYHYFIIFLPLIVILWYALLFMFWRALVFRKLFQANNKAPLPPPPVPAPPPDRTPELLEKQRRIDELLRPRKELQDLLARYEDEERHLREGNTKLEDQIRELERLIRERKDEIDRLLRRKPETVVERVPVERIKHVPVEREVRVEVPRVVEVPKVVEKTVEVQKLVIDKAAQLRLQYAQDDIEYLKRELHAARLANATDPVQKVLLDDEVTPDTTEDRLYSGARYPLAELDSPTRRFAAPQTVATAEFSQEFDRRHDYPAAVPARPAAAPTPVGPGPRFPSYPFTRSAAGSYDFATDDPLLPTPAPSPDMAYAQLAPAAPAAPASYYRR